MQALVGFKNYLHSFINSFINFCYLQFFLMLISLPILISWGLPISLTTIFGNFFFTPFLTLFLLLSSLLLFFEIAHIPNYFIAYLLDFITRVWYFLLTFDKKYWLIGFAKPSLIVLFIIFFLTI